MELAPSTDPNNSVEQQAELIAPVSESTNQGAAVNNLVNAHDSNTHQDVAITDRRSICCSCACVSVEVLWKILYWASLVNALSIPRFIILAVVSFQLIRGPVSSAI